MNSRLLATLSFAVFFAAWAQSSLCHASGLTPAEAQREAWDSKQYPHLMAVLKAVDPSKRMMPTDPHNLKLVPAPEYFDPEQKIWDDFFKATAADHLTLLRAFGLLARELKKRNVIMWGSGAAFEKAVADNHVELGLAIPARNIAAAVWSPLPRRANDPEFQLRLTVFYTESFIHRFQDEVLPANLKIGYGDKGTYWENGKSQTFPMVEADIYYGLKKGVGFRNVKGIGGEKRGFMGFMQKVLFFLPDAIHSMIIDERSGEMVNEALVNTTVKDFEKNPLYSVKIKE